MDPQCCYYISGFSRRIMYKEKRLLAQPLEGIIECKGEKGQGRGKGRGRRGRYWGGGGV